MNNYEPIVEIMKMPKKIDRDDLIDQLVSDLALDVLVGWADILNVEHDFEQWLDDDYPDKEDELRVKVAEAMRKVGEK